MSMENGGVAPSSLSISARNLSKKFGNLSAVDSITFSVAYGECVGFLGPNGAGKTTATRMLACTSPITSGDAEILGLDPRKSPREIKRQLGICPQEDNLDPDFDVETNLRVYARYFGITGKAVNQRVSELLDFFELKEKSHSKIRELSGGMKRRLTLARSLLNSPKLLILDEPTTGLDPQVRQLIWARIRKLKENGVTILVTTHYMEEATQLCDRVILMNKGKILLDGNPHRLVNQEIGNWVIELWNVSDEIRKHIQNERWPHEEVEGRIYIYDQKNGELSAAFKSIFPGQAHLVRPASLEDVFLKIAGRTLNE